MIELMRFVFSIVIVLYHGQFLGGGNEHALFGKMGYLAVEFFFIVSGFLMAQSASKHDSDGLSNIGIETTRFVFRKIKVILPYYIPAAVISVIWMIINDSPSMQKLITGVWGFGFLQMSGIKTFAVVAATWYLSAMFISMLLLYPLLRRFKDEFFMIIAPLTAIAILGYLSQTYGVLDLYANEFHVVYAGLLRAIADICVGCICWRIVFSLRDCTPNDFTRVIIGIAVVLGFLLVLYTAQHGVERGIDFAMIVAFALSISLTFWQCDWAVMHNPIFAWLGKLSMVIYLNHRWVQYIIRTVLPESLGYAKLLAVFVICTFAISVIEMTVFESIKKRSKKTVKAA